MRQRCVAVLGIILAVNELNTSTGFIMPRRSNHHVCQYFPTRRYISPLRGRAITQKAQTERGEIQHDQSEPTSKIQLSGIPRQVKTACLLLLSSSSSMMLQCLAPPPSSVMAMAAMREPSRQQITEVQEAFRAFNRRDFDKAESLFTKALQAWEELERPRDEIAPLLKARGEVRCDKKDFAKAVEDYDRVLSLMSSDGEKADGSAAYSEYPDAFVQRGLAYEGLGRWDDAVRDYTKSIELWGGGRGEGINPFVLTFRGNSLTKLGQYADSLEDYKAAADLFLQTRDEENANVARANYALALYQTGDRGAAVKIMKDVTRRSPGFADMHVALAAHAWSAGDLATAENEWRFTCESTSVGCSKYRDIDWVGRIRRWPPVLTQQLDDFLKQKRLGSFYSKPSAVL